MIYIPTDYDYPQLNNFYALVHDYSILKFGNYTNMKTNFEFFVEILSHYGMLIIKIHPYVDGKSQYLLCGHGIAHRNTLDILLEIVIARIKDGIISPL